MNEPQHPSLHSLAIRAVRRWGAKEQWGMAIEECAELIVARSHFVRGRVSHDDLVSEVADVTIVMAQARHMLGERAVDEAINLKLSRLAARLEEAGAK